MDRFCTRCGSPLDGESGLCPKCDKKALQKLRRVRKKARPQNTRIRTRSDAVEETGRPDGAEGVQRNGRPKRAGKKARPDGAKRARKPGCLIAALVCAAFLVCGTAAVLVRLGVLTLPGQYDAASESRTLSGNFSDVRVTDEESAKQAARDAAKTLRLGNAADDLTVNSVARFDETVYYRFQQNYNGVPVYGRTVTVIADADGNAAGFSTNALPVGRVSFDKAADTDAIQSALRAYFSNNALMIEPLSDADRRIFMDDGKAVAAYAVTVPEFPFTTVIVNAVTGEVLTLDSDVDEDRATVRDNDGHYTVDGFLDTTATPNQYQLYDSGRNIKIYSYERTNSRNQNPTRTFLVSDNEIFGDTDDERRLEQEKGVELLYYVSRFKDFYKLYCNDDGYPMTEAYYNDLFDGGENALGGTRNGNGYLSIGAVTGVSNLDVVAHEYTHVVTRNIVNWAGKTSEYPQSDESGAINEAYSDIFGELIVQYLTGNPPDWVHGSRILHDPMSNGRADAAGAKTMEQYRDGNGSVLRDRYGQVIWIMTVDGGGIDDYCHGYSTVISHCAYLMTIGVDGATYTRLPYERLITLWYRTLYAIPSNCTFEALRENMELTALLNGFSDAERECIAAAFDAVGIAGDEPDEPGDTYIESCKLTVRDRVSQPYDDYTVRVSGKKYTGLFKTGLFTEDYTKTLRASDPDPLPLNIPKGDYTLTVSDNFNPTLTVQIDIKIRPRGKNKELYLDTKFGFDYTIRSDTELTVYDTNRSIYDNYSIQTDGVPDTGGEYHNRVTVSDTRPVKLNLSDGKYSVLFVDNLDSAKTRTVTFRVQSSGLPAVRLQTDFGERAGSFVRSDAPRGAVEWNGHYYYIYSTELPWDAARAFCISVNGYLATITSQEEQDFLQAYVERSAAANAVTNTDGAVFAWEKELWIGATDAATERNWVWDNGEAFDYTHWAQNQPDDYGGQDYGVMFTYLSEGDGWRIEPGQWDDSNAVMNPFICEWGEYTPEGARSGTETPRRKTSDERDAVLVLDVSGSMQGQPIEETKRAASSFVQTVLEQDASIGVVTYDESARLISDFSMDADALTESIDAIGAYGATNIEDGLRNAYDLLRYSNGRKKLIVLMSDGEPNRGKQGDALVAYADELKSAGVIIYTLGFFTAADNPASAQALMERIASDGCHYEVDSAEDLVFFFGDVADQINGQPYIYIRVACPVDVFVTYDGETLDSSADGRNTRTSFGTLTFEQPENPSEDGDLVKVLRLKEGVSYDVHLEGTGRGRMNYTIGFMDENGEYTDLRRFPGVPITRKTLIDTSAARTKTTVLNVDEDGDGRYESRYRAGVNARGELVKNTWMFYAGAGAVTLVVLVTAAALVVRKRRRKNERGNVDGRANV